MYTVHLAGHAKEGENRFNEIWSYLMHINTCELMISLAIFNNLPAEPRNSATDTAIRSEHLLSSGFGV